MVRKDFAHFCRDIVFWDLAYNSVRHVTRVAEETCYRNGGLNNLWLVQGKLQEMRGDASLAEA